MAFDFLDDNESLMRMVGNTPSGDVQVLTGTNAHTGKSFYCIHFPVASVVAALTASDCTGEDALHTTLPAGTTLFIGTVTAITLTSGVVIGYTK